VLQSDELSALSTVIIAPTSTAAASSWLRPEVEIDGRRTRVLVEQVVAVDPARLSAPVGALRRAEVEDVDRALRIVLGLS
jgi:mRNA interferase MazF